MASRQLPPIPKVVGPNGKRPCRGCGKEVPKGRQTWCSTECRDEHYMGLSSFVRPKLFLRDKGVCAVCGFDARLAEKIVERLWWADDTEKRLAAQLYCKALGIYVGYWSHRRHLWEADHIVPLAEGGTNKLENYRTLCVACHKQQTKELAARLAVARRERHDLD